MTRINQIAEGIYRISAFSPAAGISFNQFLIAGERPTLIHTGTYAMYEEVKQAVSEILDPRSLAYLVVSHLEADECGSMARFGAEAPQMTLICSNTGARINFMQWGYPGQVRGVQDGEVLELGQHRLRFLETPHVHCWDALMAIEETTGSLFTADLFSHPGDQPDMVSEDLSQQMCQFYRTNGVFAAAEPVLRVLKRLEKLSIQGIHPMHGGSIPGEALPRYALAFQSEPFAFDGRVFGRMLPE
jgi:flavorubredoxin